MPGARCAHRLDLRLEEGGPFGKFAAFAFGGRLGLGSALLRVLDALDQRCALALHAVDEPLPRPLESGQPPELSERRLRPLPRLVRSDRIHKLDCVITGTVVLSDEVTVSDPIRWS